METLAHAKESLRSSMRALRDSVPVNARAEASRQVVETIRRVPLYREAASCLAYIPFGSEVDISPLLDEPGDGRTIYVTRPVFATRALEVCAYPCPLSYTRSGFAYPSTEVACVPVDHLPSEAWVALVPGLAFSRTTGHRLGYGAGFYDAFLASHHIPTIGVGFSFQVLDELPHGPMDVPVDLLVTEQGVITP